MGALSVFAFRLLSCALAGVIMLQHQPGLGEVVEANAWEVVKWRA